MSESSSSLAAAAHRYGKIVLGVNDNEIGVIFNNFKDGETCNLNTAFKNCKKHKISENYFWAWVDYGTNEVVPIQLPECIRDMCFKFDPETREVVVKDV